MKKVFIPNQKDLGVGIVVSQKWLSGELKELRVYFKLSDEIKSLSPNDVVFIKNEDN